MVSVKSELDKKYLDRLSLWDSRLDSLAPLTDKQKESVIELNTFIQRPVPKNVSGTCI